MSCAARAEAGTWSGREAEDRNRKRDQAGKPKRGRRQKLTSADPIAHAHANLPEMTLPEIPSGGGSLRHSGNARTSRAREPPGKALPLPNIPSGGEGLASDSLTAHRVRARASSPIRQGDDQIIGSTNRCFPLSDLSSNPPVTRKRPILRQQDQNRRAIGAGHPSNPLDARNGSGDGSG
jgi:hypothetical protein